MDNTKQEMYDEIEKNGGNYKPKMDMLIKVSFFI